MTHFAYVTAGGGPAKQSGDESGLHAFGRLVRASAS
jgi:hypothetical protein